MLDEAALRKKTVGHGITITLLNGVSEQYDNTNWKLNRLYRNKKYYTVIFLI